MERSNHGGNMDTTTKTRRILNTDSIITEFGLDHDDLIKHWDAHQHLSYTGSEAKLKKINNDVRTNCTKLYRFLRENNIYPAKPVEGKMKFKQTTDYYHYWLKWMKSQKDHPEWQFITLEEVKDLFKKSSESVKTIMSHKQIFLTEDADFKTSTPGKLDPSPTKLPKSGLEDIPF